MFTKIIKELKQHAPFTALGAFSGITLMFIFRDISQRASYEFFYLFHPIHVLLSALVTATMYKRHSWPKEKSWGNLSLLLVIGYAGSIGIATLSDSIMPYLGEILLNMPHREVHLGFIEKSWLINAAAIVGISIAYFNPATKLPHSAHILVSTWASLFHILMAKGSSSGGSVSLIIYGAVFIFLFLAVWLPCCVSDIVFPLLFVKDK